MKATHYGVQMTAGCLSVKTCLRFAEKHRYPTPHSSKCSAQLYHRMPQLCHRKFADDHLFAAQLCLSSLALFASCTGDTC